MYNVACELDLGMSASELPYLSLQLPINLYESLMEIMEGQPHILYTKVTYSLATEEAERIGVDHIARSSVTGTSQTSAGGSFCEVPE